MVTPWAHSLPFTTSEISGPNSLPFQLKYSHCEILPHRPPFDAWLRDSLSAQPLSVPCSVLLRLRGSLQSTTVLLVAFYHTLLENSEVFQFKMLSYFYYHFLLVQELFTDILLTIKHKGIFLVIFLLLILSLLRHYYQRTYSNIHWGWLYDPPSGQF